MVALVIIITIIKHDGNNKGWGSWFRAAEDQSSEARTSKRERV